MLLLRRLVLAGVILQFGGAAIGQVTVTPDRLQFPTNSSADPNRATLLISAANPTPIRITTSVSSGGSWLSVSATNAVAPISITVSVDPTGLPGGNYSGSIEISTNSILVATVPVSFTVSINLTFSPVAVTFRVPEFGGPVVQSLRADSTAPGLVFSVEYTSVVAQGWLNVQQSTPIGGSASFQLTARPNFLRPGTYTAGISIGYAFQRKTFPVTLIVEPIQRVAATPALVVLNYTQGGSIPSQTIELQNLSPTDTYAVEAFSIKGWLKASIAAGVSSNAPQFSITADVSSLAPGGYAGLVIVRTPNRGYFNIAVGIRVSGVARPAATLNPTSLVVDNPSLNASFQVTINTALATSFTVRGFAPGLDQWLGARNPEGQTVSSGSVNSAQLDIGVNYSEMRPGTYSALLEVTTPMGSAIIPATLILNTDVSNQYRFKPIAPCRIMETRAAYNFEGRVGPYGPPSLTRNGVARILPMTDSNVCPLPESARVFSLNITAIPQGPLSELRVNPSGTSLYTTTLMSGDSQILANTGLISAGVNALAVQASNATDVVMDVNGYFSNSTLDPDLRYYPLKPCRAIDTRSAYRPESSEFGPPSLTAQGTRRFPLRASPDCKELTGATAYVATITAIPNGPLQFVTLWPSGTAQPNVSSINSPSGRIVANTVILPAAPDGSIDVFAYNSTDLVLDISGIFPPDDGVNGLLFTPVTNCVLHLDSYADASTRAVPVTTSTNCLIPSTAKAVSINVFSNSGGAPMPFLTIYPTGQPRPNTSMLNAFEGQTIANATIVPLGVGGSFDVFAYRASQISIVLNGYFSR